MSEVRPKEVDPQRLIEDLRRVAVEEVSVATSRELRAYVAASNMVGLWREAERDLSDRFHQSDIKDGNFNLRLSGRHTRRGESSQTHDTLDLTSNRMEEIGGLSRNYAYRVAFSFAQGVLDDTEIKAGDEIYFYKDEQELEDLSQSQRVTEFSDPQLIANLMRQGCADLADVLEMEGQDQKIKDLVAILGRAAAIEVLASEVRLQQSLRNAVEGSLTITEADRRWAN